MLTYSYTYTEYKDFRDELGIPTSMIRSVSTERAEFDRGERRMADESGTGNGCGRQEGGEVSK